jgi:hypothetical protein
MVGKEVGRRLEVCFPKIKRIRPGRPQAEMNAGCSKKKGYEAEGETTGTSRRKGP